MDYFDIGNHLLVRAKHQQNENSKQIYIQEALLQIMKAYTSDQMPFKDKENCAKIISENVAKCSKPFQQSLTNQKNTYEDLKIKAWIESTKLSDSDIKETSFDDLVLPQTTKDRLKRDILFPIEFFSSKPEGIEPHVLLYGPPGTGKTSCLHAIATECKKKKIKVAIYKISCGDLLRPFYGETEMLCKALFKEIRATAPSIVFLDEVDGLCSARRSSGSEASHRLKTELLQCIDTEFHGFFSLAASNLAPVRHN